MKTTLLALLAAAATTAASALPPEIAEALARVATYEEGQTRVAVIAVDHFVAEKSADANVRRELAAQMASLLGKTGTTASARTFFCRQLGIVGGKAEVAAIAKLLQNPATIDDARLALEPMPAPAAGAALRDALETARGPAAAGLMNSLARRGDMAALPQFAARLADADPAVAEAAARALAQLGTKPALAALAAAKGPGAAAARRDCTIRLASRGDVDAADKTLGALFDAATASDETIAVLSAWSTLPGKAARALAESITNADAAVSLTAIRLAAAPASGVSTKELVGRLTALDESRQAALLRALGERGDPAALPALLEHAAAGPESRRIAALEAIGQVGTAESVPLLADTAAASAGAIRAAAVQALGRLRGSDVDDAVMKGLRDRDPARRAVMIEVAVTRRMTAAVPPLLEAIASGDAAAGAAARGLAELADATTYPQLVAAMAKTPGADLRRAVVETGRRIPDEAARVRPLVEALNDKSAAPEGMAAALSALAEFGGGPALAAVRERVTSNNTVVREAALKALAGWPDPAAAGDLLGLLPGLPDPAQRAAVLRGFLRLAPMSPRAVSLLRQAAPSLLSDDERRQWLGAVSRVSSSEALELAQSQLKNPAVAAEASAAALAIAETIAKTNAAAADVRKVLIVTGLDYPGHKWRETTPVLQAAIARDPRLRVEVSEDVSVLGRIRPGEYAAIVLNYMNWENPGPSAETLENFRRCIEGGTGLVLVHFACGAFQAWPDFVKIAGRVWNPKLRAHDPRGAFTVRITDSTHPATAGVGDFETPDELYTCLDGLTPIRVLAQATSKVDQKDYPMAFVLEYGKGRVFHCVLGHDVKALEPAGVQALYREGTAWVAGLEPRD